MTRLAIRAMLRANKPGIILLASSTGAQKSSIITPLYGVSKHGISSFIRAMGPLHSMAGIRVVGVAPGPTMSPLMYDHPEAFRFVDPEKDKLASPEQIANGMVAVALDKGRYASGTVLEITGGPDRWRVVHMLNDPGPQGVGSWTSRKDEAVADVKAIIEGERGKL
jgi:3-hydroxybutyrate dehydrogenase